MAFKLGSDVSDQVNWLSPRLVCVASDFTHYDEYAIAQIDRSIDLVCYRDYDGAFLTLDLFAASTTAAAAGGDSSTTGKSAKKPGTSQKTVTELREQAPEDLGSLYDSLEIHMLSLGEDVTKTTTQFYYAFRRIKNFACVEVHPQSKKLLLYLKTDPSGITLEPGFTRDVTKIGHFGTGNLEVTLGDPEDLERAKPLILTSYRIS